MSHAPVKPATPKEFQALLLVFINQRLPEIRPPKTLGIQALPDTLLFDSGLVDSMGIVQLILFVEETLGQPIPTRMIVMKHFRTIDAIVEAFWPTHGERQ